jgi:hypothetical protein
MLGETCTIGSSKYKNLKLRKKECVARRAAFMHPTSHVRGALVFPNLQ